MPGGFYTPTDDTIESCAIRELREETGVVVDENELKLVKISSGNNRDPRGWIVSVAYKVVLEGDIKPLANSDVILCKWYDVDQLPNLKLAFDHEQIITAALK